MISVSRYIKIVSARLDVSLSLSLSLPAYIETHIYNHPRISSFTNKKCIPWLPINIHRVLRPMRAMPNIYHSPSWTAGVCIVTAVLLPCRDFTFWTSVIDCLGHTILDLFAVWNVQYSTFPIPSRLDALCLLLLLIVFQVVTHCKKD